MLIRLAAGRQHHLCCLLHYCAEFVSNHKDNMANCQIVAGNCQIVAGNWQTPHDGVVRVSESWTGSPQEKHLYAMVCL